MGRGTVFLMRNDDDEEILLTRYELEKSILSTRQNEVFIIEKGFQIDGMSCLCPININNKSKKVMVSESKKRKGLQRLVKYNLRLKEIHRKQNEFDRKVMKNREKIQKGENHGYHDPPIVAKILKPNDVMKELLKDKPKQG